MRRDFILVCGNQGFGKSVWTKIYAANQKRLLVFDPKGEYPNVDYLSPPDEWIPDVVDHRREAFRYGTYLAEEIEMFWNAAFAAQNCTLINEECTLLFNRGEDIPPWARPMVFMGREPQLNLVLVTQRANSIPVAIRSQASRIVTFLQTEPDDVRALAARIGRDRMEEIATLPELDCLDWQAGQGIRRYAVRP